MRGTPGFVGARLREAREARGLTAVSLAELIGVTRAAVSLYETTSVSPGPDTMERISDVLNLPAQFFLRPVSDEPDPQVIYRSMAAATKAARTRAERRFGWLREIVEYLWGFIEFPSVNLPPFSLPEDITTLSDEDIEELAEEARRFWRLGDSPIGNLVWLLENNGVVVTRGELGAATLDAFSAWEEPDGRPYIFLGSEKGTAVRSRLDAAHELGHLLLDRHISRTALNKPAIFKEIERRAFRFGLAFLLPAASFARDFTEPTMDRLRILKPKHLVSIAGMIQRAEQLGLITEKQAESLWRSRSFRGWIKNEPLDDELEPEQPRVLRRAFELLLEQRIVTKDEIRTELPYAVADITELAGLPTDALVDSPPNLRVLDPGQRRRASEPSRTGDFGRLAEFPNQS